MNSSNLKQPCFLHATNNNVCVLNPILGGGLISPPHDFSTVAPKRQYKVGVMGYVNLSYFIGKTPKKVLGSKKNLGPDPEALKVGPTENSGGLKSRFFTLG